MKLIISDKRQKLIDEKNNLPLTIGESVFVNTEAINGRKYLNKNPATKPCIIVSINDDYLIVKEEASLNNSRHEIKRSDIVSRNNRMVGANPFDENVDNITCKAYTLECILIELNIPFDPKNSNETYDIAGIPSTSTNWNPFIYDADYNKKYYQRGLVWSIKDQQLLIESIYLGIDCGKILIRKRSWAELLEMRRMGETTLAWSDIVDGKQRLTAISDFISGKFPDFHGNYYGDLSQFSQRKFIGHQLFSFGEMPENSKDKDVIRQFLKLNHCGVPQSEEHINFIKSLLEK